MSKGCLASQLMRGEAVLLKQWSLLEILLQAVSTARIGLPGGRNETQRPADKANLCHIGRVAKCRHVAHEGAILTEVVASDDLGARRRKCQPSYKK